MKLISLFGTFYLIHLSVGSTSWTPEAEAVHATDLTLVEKAIGQDVVFATVSKIQRTFIFPEDYDLLKRIAYVESKFGDEITSFPPGIWQLTQTQFDATKSSTLATSHEGILKKFNIDWPTTTWNDLLKPLYSGLAARLFLSTIATPIPQTVNGQAKHWLQFYSNTVGNTEAEFIEKVTIFENSTVCKGKMDLMVVLDESGSIGPDNFKLALQFVAKLFGSYSLTNVREGFITFSSSNRIIFGLDSGLNAGEIQEKVLSLNYGQGETNSNDALYRAVGLFRGSAERPGVPRVMTFFTDGQSNMGDPVSDGAAAAQEANITTFAIGIAAYNKTELEIIANGDPAKVFTLNDFDALTDFFHRLNAETCEVPQKPGLNETVEEEIEKNEKRIYYFDVPANGVTVYFILDNGDVESYYSHTVSDPSSALNDGVILVGTTYIFPETNTLWISVTGKADRNKYAILVVANLEAPTTTTSTTTTTEAPTTTTEEPEEPPTEPPTTQEPTTTTEEPTTTTTEPSTVITDEPTTEPSDPPTTTTTEPPTTTSEEPEPSTTEEPTTMTTEASTTTTTEPSDLPTTEESTTTTTEEPTEVPITTEEPTTTTTEPPTTTTEEATTPEITNPPTTEASEPPPTTPEATTSSTTPKPGNGGACSNPGTTPDPKDCQLYHVCSPNPVGDYWVTIHRCPDDLVWCQEKMSCQSNDICPCNLWLDDYYNNYYDFN